ncbi:MAG: Asp-tRNA(Asn)/Glu-tRNA(Gln) amidotransferase subunit GatA [Bdellovibrionales bacterium]|nr:Asp-tRNA(Asn)/Glu-tRNA(Gln) amidotransferase subunit GatA [Bdellovibrionales bacterium]
MEVMQLGAFEISRKVQSGELTAQAVTEYFLQRCHSYNTSLNAVLHISEQAIDQARAIDKKDKTKLKLAGVPVLLKDMFCTQGMPTTAGSKILQNFVPPYSSTVTEKLVNAGAIILGKCNQDEFAMGSSNETSYFGTCKNPWNIECVTGGSSGGSAAAVAARLAPVSLGTDTGGSIRQPANFCGVFGIKPTYSRVSRHGIIAYASSFDQAGPITNRVRDSALVLETISGYDPKDMTTTEGEVPTFSQINKTKKIRVGKIKSFFNKEVSAEVLHKTQEVIAHLQSEGFSVQEVELDHLEVAVDTYYLLATSEASSNLSRYDGVRYGYRADFSKNPPLDLEDFYARTRSEGFGQEVKRRIALGTYALSSGYFEAYFLQAAKVRRLIKNSFVSAFHQVDVLVSPVTTETAFKIGEKISDPLAMYYNDAFTTCVNLAGLPAASVPIGFDQKGLPIGLQIIGNYFKEEDIFSLAQYIEQQQKCYQEVPLGFA